MMSINVGIWSYRKCERKAIPIIRGDYANPLRYEKKSPFEMVLEAENDLCTIHSFLLTQKKKKKKKN